MGSLMIFRLLVGCELLVSDIAMKIIPKYRNSEGADSAPRARFPELDDNNYFQNTLSPVNAG